MKGCCTQCKKLMKGFIAKMSEIFRGGHHNAVPLYAVYMSRAFLSSKIRLLIDFLHKYLNGDEA